MKVDALSVKSFDAKGQEITGLECSECGQRFFDEIREDQRISESGVEKFIQHAEDEHQSSGGVIGVKKARMVA